LLTGELLIIFYKESKVKTFKMKPKAALFIKTKNLGDSVILTSAIASLPQDYSYVDVLCLLESKAIFEMNPRVKNIFVIPKRDGVLSAFFKYLIIFKTMLNQNYFLVAQFSEDWRGALFSLALRPKLSVARKNTRRGVFWHKSFRFLANVCRVKRPTAEQDVDLLRRVKLYDQPVAQPYQIIVPEKILEKILKWKEKNIRNNQKIIAIQHASRWKFKQIKNKTWVDVIDKLNNLNYAIVLTGSNEDFKANEELANACKKRPIICENFNIQETSALYKISDLLISIDSFSIHLASASQLPVVAIFGPTDEKNWAPWRVRHKIVSLSGLDDMSFSCRPCGLDGCGGSKVSNCLIAITPESIINAVETLIN
jgi:heptosyltransferase-3